MVEIEDKKEIKTSKVAVNVELMPALNDEVAKSLDKQTRFLSDNKMGDIAFTEAFYSDNTDRDIRLIILDALDVRIENASDDDDFTDDSVRYDALNFQWDLIDYDKEYLWLQTSFDNPENFGSFRSEAYIVVSFYGVDLFKNLFDVEV